jgi:hypothetical protein
MFIAPNPRNRQALTVVALYDKLQLIDCVIAQLQNSVMKSERFTPMNTQTQSIASLVEASHCACPSVLPAHGPVQFLIIDTANGPADIVFDVFGRLFEAGVTLTLVSTREEVRYALDCYNIDLLVLGLDNSILESLTLVPGIRKDHPNMPVMGLGHNLSPFQLAECRQFGLDNVLEMPQRASDLKALLRVLIQRYVLE